nr:hypothetical protein [Bacteroidales bacterium]
VKKLTAAIDAKNLLHVNPILVTGEMKVIDGQHRLAAAETLKVPIYYLVAEDLEPKDISKLNSNQKNWVMMDYINFYAVEKVHEFQVFSRFAVKHSEFRISGLLSIINEDTMRNTKAIKAGELNVFDIDKAEEVCEICTILNERFGYDFVFDAVFPVAIKKAINTNGFDLENLYSKIAAAPRAFVVCRNLKEYIAMIEDVYNYKLRENKIIIK